MTFLLFLSIAIQRDAPRGLIPSPKTTLLSFYFRPFVISTTIVLEDRGSGVARMTASKWQPRLSYIRFGLTGDPGRVVFLSLSSISFALFFLFFSLRFSSFYVSSFLLFFAKLFVTERIAFPPQTAFSLLGFFRFYLIWPRELSLIIRNNVIMFARTLVSELSR